MKQLIYVSDANLPADADPAFVALQIVIQSMHKNRLVDVTGFLVSSGDRFLQVLEGPIEQVQRTFDRIAVDPRHKNLVVLSDKPTQHRLFHDWSMATSPESVTLPAVLNAETATQALLDASERDIADACHRG